MEKRIVKLFLLLSCSVTAVMGQTGAGKSVAERVGDTGFVRVDAESFQSLDAKQRELAYWLTQASIAIDPIAYDQFSKFGLRQKRLLEGIVAHADGIDAGVRAKVADFTKLLWANKGNHNELTSQKFMPSFTFEELKQAAHIAQKNGGFSSVSGDLPAIATLERLNNELENLRASLFDPNFEPMLTAKNPSGGLDAIQASSNTFYEGVTLADLKDFHDAHPLNSRVVRSKDGKLREEVYRAGTPEGKVAPGLYATYLKRANEYLAKAQRVADPGQAKAIGDLIRYYQTGDPSDWMQFGTDWVQNNALVDFVNGFVEIYRDARGAKASSQTFVSITDKPVTETMVRLGDNASYFEEKAPWDAKYKKQTFQPPVVKAVETLIEAGDFGVTVIGDNLPNENEIHEKYGTKNFLFTSSTRALNSATGDAMAKEFASSREIAERSAKYGDEAGDLMTALHEVIGHGSGKLSDRLKSGAEPYLKGYFSTLEEARADLSALWNAWDPKLRELGLVSNQEEVAKAMYDNAAMVALTQLRRIPKGDTIEEDHERDRQLYAVHFDPALRDQVVARYKKLNIPTYWAGINSRLTAQTAADGHLSDVEISYPADAIEQYLAYGSMYDKSLLAARKAEKKKTADN